MSKPIHLLWTAALAAVILCGCGAREGSQGHREGEDAGHEEHGEEHHDVAQIDAQAAAELGIVTAKVGAGTVSDAHEVQGLLTPIESKHARVRARYAGPVQRVRVGVGDVVKTGQTLATVESNASLTSYAVSAPFGGTILDVAAVPGDLAADQPLFELADLSSLWVDLHLFGGDAQHIAAGMPVEIIRLSDGARVTTRLDRILPGTATASQSTVARATIQNADGQWRPGAAVRARVTVRQREAALVVPVQALQTFEGETVVFTRQGNSYTPREVKLGERDALHAEVLAGLSGGEEIVVEQSYLIKADLEKESAGHEH